MGGVLLAVLFFVFGVGRREGFVAYKFNSSLTPSCSSIPSQGNCTQANCVWTPASCSDTKYTTSISCNKNGQTWTKSVCSS